jgi:hypothetical protein
MKTNLISTCLRLMCLVMLLLNAIPYPLPEWKGVQGKTLADSKPDFIGQPKAPKDAPNVLDCNA